MDAPVPGRYVEEAFGCEHSFTFPVVNLAAWRSRMAELQALAAYNPMAVLVLPESLDEYFFDILDTEEPDMVMQRLNSLERVMLRREKAAGIQEGLLEGRMEGEAQMLQRQITRRFGPLAQETLDRLKTATAAQLETWSLNLLDAPTLEDVFRE